MKVAVKIEEDLFAQLAQQLKVERKNHSLKLASSMGIGSINFRGFPNSLEFYHFSFTSKSALQLTCINSAKSDYFLIKINLSEQATEKRVNGRALDIQKYLPSGILYYPSNTHVATDNPKNKKYDILLIKFHKDLISTYFQEEAPAFLHIQDTIIYEDLDFKSEELLRKVIDSGSKINAHANLLAFLSIFFEKLQLRAIDLKYVNLHPEDNKQLFLAASRLRNPIASKVPTIEELALAANMGKTKFKKIFKQVFGNPPKQYRQKIRMEYAKEELQKNQKTAAEIAYELGYAHPSKFTRAFKNHFGLLPSKVK